MTEQDRAEEPTVTTGEIVSTPDVSGEWLTPPAAADRLGMSERTLWRLVRDGRYQKRLVNRRAEILVPLPVTADSRGNPGDVSLTPVKEPDSLALAILEDLKARDAAKDEIIRQKDARIIELERENAVLKADSQRQAPWYDRLRDWWQRVGQ